MNQEETEVSQALWAAFDDLQLLSIQARVVGSIPAARLAEWMSFVLPAVSPMERRLLEAKRTAPTASRAPS
jgi:hypothetical protein